MSLPIEFLKSDPTLARDLGLTQQEQSRLKSPTSLLADRLIKDASDGLIALNQGESSPMNGVMVVDKFKKFSTEGLKYWKNLEATLYFGATLRAIEDTIINGEYDHYKFSVDIDHITGQYGPRQVNASFENDRPEKIDRGKLLMMRTSAKKDPYFVNIIEQGRVLLPSKLYNTLLRSGHLRRIREIVPLYAHLTDELPKINPGEIGRRAYQVKRLNEFDVDIDRVIFALDDELEDIKSNQEGQAQIGEQDVEEPEPSQDRIETLAKSLIENGGMEYQSNKDRQGKGTYSQDLYAAQEINIKAAIFLGATLLAIKGMLRSGKYDHPSFAKRVNKALGSEMIKINPDGYDFYDLRSDYYDLLFSLSRADSTLSLFLENPRSLPPEIRNELEHHDLVEAIKQILPKYREVANEMLPGEEYDVVLEATKVAVFAQDDQRMSDLTKK